MLTVSEAGALDVLLIAPRIMVSASIAGANISSRLNALRPGVARSRMRPVSLVTRNHAEF